MKPIAVLSTIRALLALCVTVTALASCASGVKTERFGSQAKQEVQLYTIVNKNGLIAKLTNYGALLTELHVPDRDGQFEDIVLGFDTLPPYLKRHPYFGCTTGRYANRIAKGKFTLDGKDYQLATNNTPNHLHGGNVGLDQRIWDAKIEAPGCIVFSYLSPAGEEGYPGNLQIEVKYQLTDYDELRIHYTATTDKATPVNLTHHSYFNLAGAGNGDILGHELKIFADHYTPVDDTSIPTGQIRAVADSPMDFTQSTAIGARIAHVPGGYDHNYVLRGQKGTLELAARLYNADSGRVMDLLTTEPGVQLYTGNYLDGTVKGKEGKSYEKHAGICLEAQHYPDSVNQPDFPSTILRPGETYTQTTVHRFFTLPAP